MSELDKQIEVIVSIACGAELGLLDDECVDEDIKRMNAAIRANKDRLRKPIKALIANQVREARIAELEEYLQWYMGREDATIFIDRQVVEELLYRIDELKGGDK